MYNLNCKISVRRSAAIQNIAGGLVETLIGSWNKWAQVDKRSGSGNDEYQTQKWVYDQKFTMRYEQSRPTKSNDTIVYDNARYKIVSLEIIREGHNFWEVCRCQKIDNNVGANAPDAMDNVNVYDYTASTVTDEFTVSALIGKKVIGAFKDGIQYKVVTGAPSSTGKEVQFNIVTGTFTWAFEFAIGETAMIQYYG